MRRRRKTITLPRIKQLWKQTGRQPVEIKLITKELVNFVISQPRQTNPTYLQMQIPSSQDPSTLGHGHRLRWMAAACVALLMVAGIVALMRTAEVPKTELTTAQAEPLPSQENENTQPASAGQHELELERETMQNCDHQYALVEMKHEWQTVQKPSLDQAKHKNGGMVCYSGGSISDRCDEETVTSMLLAFL